MAFFTSLYSGSSGNCSVVRCGDEYLMIDMGKNCKTTVNALKELELPVGAMQGLLITHEHSDHVSGLRVFLKHHEVSVYGGVATLDHLAECGILPPQIEAVAIQGRTENIGGFEVTAFPTSHDVPCCGYRIKAPDGSVMAMATDLGYLSNVVNENLEGCSLVALESNYDLHALRCGPYPSYLKYRIESDRGHLDNTVCARKVVELMKAGCEKFALCHLSKENNSPEIALAAIRNQLAQEQYVPAPGVRVQVQHRDCPSEWMEF